ncbi:unnamed protein product, partial [Prorocentrum cordatum]
MTSDDKLDQLLQSFQGFGQQLASSSYEIPFLEKQGQTTQQRFDALITQIGSLSTEMEKKDSLLKGHVSATWADLNDGVVQLKVEGNTRIKNAAPCHAMPAYSMHVGDDDGPHGTAQQRIQATKEQLKSISTPHSSAGSRSTFASHTVKAQDNSCKLIVIGFPRRMVQSTLRNVGDASRLEFVRTDPRYIIATLDSAKKITLEFEIADSLAPTVPLSLRVKRDQGITGRQLFLSMGRLRSCLTRVPRDMQIPVVSSGVGGLARAFRGQEGPAPTVQLSCAEGHLGASVDVDA